jgi:HK97 family phage portal protein
LGVSILDNLIRRFGYIKAAEAINAGPLLASVPAEKYRIPDGSIYESQAELYRRLSWVLIAVKIVSENAATTRFAVKKLKGEKTEEIINHPFELLLRRPNPLMSRFEFLVSTVSFRTLTGNAYWWKNKPSEDAPPEEMWIIPSHMIRPIPDERLYLRGYLYEPGVGPPIALEPWEITHFKSFNPFSPFVGQSVIEALATIAVGDLKMQEWNTRLFAENNARLPGILAFADPIAPDEWEKIKEDTRDKASKRDLMMLRNVGSGGVEWIQAASTMRDMEFLMGRQFTKEEIFAAIAPGLSSMLAINATEANAATGKGTFSEFGLWPTLVSMAEKISNDIIPGYGDDLIGEFDDIRGTDRMLELQEQQEFAKTHTIDEIREEFYEDTPLGDDRGLMLPAQIAAAPVPSQSMSSIAPELFQPREELAEPMPEEIQPVDNLPDRETMRAEINTWKRKALNRADRGEDPYCNFESDIIPLELKAKVLSLLAGTKSAHDVEAIFDAVNSEELGDYGNFKELIDALKENTKAMRR